MSKAERIADDMFDPGLQPENHKAVMFAVNVALEWAAKQCEREDYHDFVDGAWYAKQIRAGKSA